MRPPQTPKANLALRALVRPTRQLPRTMSYIYWAFISERLTFEILIKIPDSSKTDSRADSHACDVLRRRHHTQLLASSSPHASEAVRPQASHIAHPSARGSRPRPTPPEARVSSRSTRARRLSLQGWQAARRPPRGAQQAPHTAAHP